MIVEYINDDSPNHEAIFWDGAKAEVHNYVKYHGTIRIKDGIAGKEFQDMYEKTIKAQKAMGAELAPKLKLEGKKVADLGDIELYSLILTATSPKGQTTQIPFKDLVTKKQLDALIELTES